MMRQRLLLAVILACVFTTQAWSNVIYDVSIDYAGGGHTATYSFTMEFATPPPPIKTESDLINPAGDLSNENFILDGVTLSLAFDNAVGVLQFDGAVIAPFSPGDAFGTPGQGCTITQAASPICVAAGTIFLLFSVNTVVEERAVPVAPTLVLLVIGLAGLGWSRRRRQ